MTGSARSPESPDGVGSPVPAGEHPVVGRLQRRTDPAWPELLEVGVGWYDLLADLDSRLEKIAPGYVLQQCKAKYGTLRFYADPGADGSPAPDAFRDAIADAEERSARTCEVCGARARPRIVAGWSCTLCETHYASAKKSQGRSHPSV